MARVQASPVQVILALGAYFAVQVATIYAVAAPVDGVDPFGLTTLLCLWFLHIAALSLGAALVLRSHLVPVSLIAITLAMAMALLVSALVSRAIETEAPHGPLSAVIPGVVVLFPVVLVAARVFDGRFWAGLLLAIPTLALAIQAQTWPTRLLGYPPQPFYSAALPGEVPEEARVRLDIEGLYLAQGDLMERDLAALAPQREGVVDVYVLFVAGHAYESVFLSEIEAASAIVARSLDAEGRVVRLANSIREPEKYALATKRNLAAALAAIRDRMDPEEDLAFVYLTSHGGNDRFDTSFWEAGLSALTASDLAAVLGDSGLTNLIVMISACHSGSFIDDLEAPDRLIMTAAAADRQSFGCKDGNDWTWWGRAFFETGLSASADFRIAFETATTAVARWEAEAGYPASQPQMVLGRRIADRLDALTASLEAPEGAD